MQLSISRQKILDFIQSAIESNTREADRAVEDYLPPPTYWLGRANVYRNLCKRIEAGEFDESKTSHL